MGSDDKNKQTATFYQTAYHSCGEAVRHVFIHENGSAFLLYFFGGTTSSNAIGVVYDVCLACGRSLSQGTLSEQQKGGQ